MKLTATRSSDSTRLDGFKPGIGNIQGQVMKSGQPVSPEDQLQGTYDGSLPLLLKGSPKHPTGPLAAPALAQEIYCGSRRQMSGGGGVSRGMREDMHLPGLLAKHQ